MRDARERVRTPDASPFRGDPDLGSSRSAEEGRPVITTFRRRGHAAALGMANTAELLFVWSLQAHLHFCFSIFMINCNFHPL